MGEATLAIQKDAPKSRLKVVQLTDHIDLPLPDRVKDYPELRYMGSKRRLLPWIHKVMSELDFETVADPFVGSGCVAYLMKCMGKRVIASDFLNFTATLATATIANSHHHLDGPAISILQPIAVEPIRFRQIANSQSILQSRPKRQDIPVSHIPFDGSSGCLHAIVQADKPKAAAKNPFLIA